MLQTLATKVGLVNKHSDVILAIAVVGLVLLLVIPLPPVLLDALLSMSIVLAVTTLLITMYTEEALDFSSFPSLLLFLTLFRLGLNIASTRMILSQAQAGDIIKTFGEFVTGGNQIVGLVIFILLTVINFVVITKGSGRVAEVAARFTLDAMPGKQMSIDADLNAGIIDEEEAKMRREKVSQESDFYGAMDGASKFVRGDAIAGIVIAVVNIIGGFAIGVAIKGMSWTEAINTYTVLTIGDGLVSQIPALLISVGAGVIVTRASSRVKLATAFRQQVFNNPRVLFITAVIILLLGFVPGMPLIVMLPMSLGIIIYAYVLWKSAKEELSTFDTSVSSKEEAEASAAQPNDVEKVLYVDPMEIELGYGLIPLVDQTQGGDLLSRITVIRRQIASELGVVFPPIRIRDNMSLDSNLYIVKIKGIEIASGTLHLDSYLAMNPGNVDEPIAGIVTIEPAFGLPAVWISTAQKDHAEMLGYTVVDTLSVLATHLTEVIHMYAHELLNRQEVNRLIENAKEYASAVIEELIPNQLTLGQVLKVFQNLLKERVPIRDIVTILETLADSSLEIKEPEVLTEYVRQSLARTLTKQFSADEKLYVITLDPKVEQMIQESLQKSDFGSRIVMRPNTIKKIVDELIKCIDKATNEGVQPIVLTSPTIRVHFKRLIERNLPKVPVLSFNEIIADIEIESLGIISTEVLM
jgi:flagellar biosynthesis protein FlhA